MRPAGKACGAIAALILAACGSKQTPPPAEAPVREKSETATPKEITLDAAARKQAGIETAQAVRRSPAATVRANGRITLNENRSWRVGAITDGRIVNIYANPGDRVQEGQVLARMHSHDIHESRAQYRRAVAELARLKSQAEFAVRTRDRMRRLYDLKAASFEQVDQAEAHLRNAQTESSNAEVEVQRVRTHLTDFLGIAIEEKGQHAGGEHEHSEEDLIPIRSPATGVVLQRTVTPGTVVQPGGEAFVVADLSTLWMIAQVGEEDLARIRVGMPVRVAVQAYADRAFAGRVARLGEQLDPATRTLQVRVDLPNAAGLLKPEMFAAAELELGGAAPGLFIPETALQDVGGRQMIFVRRSEIAYAPRAVETGRRINGQVEIRSGLSEGDVVVTAGAFVLKSQMLKATLTEE